jgi:hypothetical protein
MPAGETPAHVLLKGLALRWAREHRLPLAAAEVRIPRSGYRADAVAASAHPAAAAGRVAVFECKQAREDLLRDCADEPGLQRRARELGARLAELRALIGGHRPDLRRGETLFPSSTTTTSAACATRPCTRSKRSCSMPSAGCSAR